MTCCGPNFAPEIDPFISLYDVVRDVMVNGKKFAGKKPLAPKLPKEISFLNEVYPLFHRLGLMEWIAAASQLRQGWIDVKSFLSETYMEKLADNSEMLCHGCPLNNFAQEMSPLDEGFRERIENVYHQ